MNARVELCFGRVMHRRARPVVNQFSYGVFFLRLPLSRLMELEQRWFSLDRFNLLSFYTIDYGPRDGSSLEAWVRKRLRDEGIDRADGEIVLQTFPRLLGYVFNPISIWYCYDRAGRLRAALCEVSNTFGEQHHYLVAHVDQRPIVPNVWLTARKLFHVSPFCEVKGYYRFRFEQTVEGPQARAFVQIDYYDSLEETAPLLVTTLCGTPQPLAARSIRRALLAYPLMTAGVIARIHWQAVKLWWKRVPFFSKPVPPGIDTSRSEAP